MGLSEDKCWEIPGKCPPNNPDPVCNPLASAFSVFFKLNLEYLRKWSITAFATGCGCMWGLLLRHSAKVSISSFFANASESPEWRQA